MLYPVVEIEVRRSSKRPSASPLAASPPKRLRTEPKEKPDDNDSAMGDLTDAPSGTSPSFPPYSSFSTCCSFPNAHRVGSRRHCSGRRRRAGAPRRSQGCHPAVLGAHPRPLPGSHARGGVCDRGRSGRGPLSRDRRVGEAGGGEFVAGRARSLCLRSGHPPIVETGGCCTCSLRTGSFYTKSFRGRVGQFVCSRGRGRNMLLLNALFTQRQRG